MPALHSYTVLRTQRLIVHSTNPVDAIDIASRFLDGEDVQRSEKGSVIRGTEIVDMSVKQESL